MKKEDLILNTIVFKEYLDRGLVQKDLLELAHSLGVRRVEIRREFIQDLAGELQSIREKADQLGIQLFYSVNEDFIVEAAINPLLPQLREEASILGAPFVKLNTGDASKISIETLAKLLPDLQEGVGVRVENNQTPGHASLKNCSLTMQKIKEANLPLSFVFDTGNWAWLGESPLRAEEVLGDYTSYLHCKNYQKTDQGIGVTSLFKGEIDILAMLTRFKDVDLIALEYPCPIDTLKADIAKLVGEF
ncbi:sugar phosphate isomerase/epimerase family protein [Streptococcus oricebi]|nr:sugar phosphate isomerase/epimerase [Streptococcus oricebi]